MRRTWTNLKLRSPEETTKPLLVQLAQEPDDASAVSRLSEDVGGCARNGAPGTKPSLVGAKSKRVVVRRRPPSLN